MDGPQSIEDYKQLIGTIIKQQIALLGKDLALGRVRNIAGLSVDEEGSVTELVGNPKELLQKVVDEYFIFSGLIVRKTMESIMLTYPGLASTITPQTPNQQPVAQVQQPEPQP